MFEPSRPLIALFRATSRPWSVSDSIGPDNSYKWICISFFFFDFVFASMFIQLPKLFGFGSLSLFALLEEFISHSALKYVNISLCCCCTFYKYVVDLWRGLQWGLWLFSMSPAQQLKLKISMSVVIFVCARFHYKQLPNRSSIRWCSTSSASSSSSSSLHTGSQNKRV